MYEFDGSRCIGAAPDCVQAVRDPGQAIRDPGGSRPAAEGDDRVRSRATYNVSTAPRLGDTSPAAEAGNTIFVSPDAIDRDAAAATSEILPSDLAGRRRIFAHPTRSEFRDRYRTAS